MFSTLTNVNFDKEEHVEILARLAQHRDYIKKKLPEDATLEHEDSPAAFIFRNDLQYLLDEGEKVGILRRK